MPSVEVLPGKIWDIWGIKVKYNELQIIEKIEICLSTPIMNIRVSGGERGLELTVELQWGGCGGGKLPFLCPHWNRQGSFMDAKSRQTF